MCGRSCRCRHAFSAGSWNPGRVRWDGTGKTAGTPECRARQGQGKPGNFGGTTGSRGKWAEPRKIDRGRDKSCNAGVIRAKPGERRKAGAIRESREANQGGGRGLSRRVGGIISPGGFRGGAPGAPTCPPSSHHKCFFLRDDDGMPSSSRYLATVRRAILTPRPSLRRELMSSSDRGWDWSSPSMRARMRALTLSEPT